MSAPVSNMPGVTLAGSAASRGFAAGNVYLHVSDENFATPEYLLPPEKALEETARYHAARMEARRQISDIADKMRARGNASEADIFSNHLLILEDASIVTAIEKFIREDHLNAEAALRRAVGRFRDVFSRMDDPYLRERVRDIDDIERRCLRILLGREETGFARISSPVIIVADDLTPSETVSLPREFVLGFATDRGSSTSHVALLARSLGIPAVVGLGNVTSRVKAGDFILLDGVAGSLTVSPDDATRADFEERARADRERLAVVADGANAPVVLADGAAGVRVKLTANVQPGIPLNTLEPFAPEGIGLYRTEYLWLSSRADPGEEEQYRAYAEAVAALASMEPGSHIVFRTLDIGGDKVRPGAKSDESNPFLGQRSIRWSLAHRDDFRAQLRAILRASALGPAAVMYPLVTDVRELREANRELAETMRELEAKGVAFDRRIRRGVMVETPAAALASRALARECDFFSIGTNDLVQYTMAADRGNERVGHLYQPTHPSVLRLVEETLAGAASTGIPVAVCGATASDPVLAALWIGMGVTGLSVGAGCIPALRKALRPLSFADVRALAEDVRAMRDTATSDEIYAFCRDRLTARVPDLAELQSFCAV